MAAPVAAKITLPDDSGNAGPKVRTQTRVVGADTVHEHFFIPTSERKKTGLYYASLALQSVQASAQNGTSTGFFWLQLPAGSAVKAALRRVSVQFVSTNTTAMLTAPRIAIARFTFTGTASGAAQGPAKRDPGDAANVAQLRTAVTGMTPTVGAILHSFMPSTVLTGVGADSPSEQEWNPYMEEGFSVIPSGEGILLYQPDAGTASDSRRFGCNVVWEEYEV